MTVTATNHGPDPAPLDICRSCGSATPGPGAATSRRTPMHQLLPPTLAVGGLEAVELPHGFLGDIYLAAEGSPEVLFCDNETNRSRCSAAA